MIFVRQTFGVFLALASVSQATWGQPKPGCENGALTREYGESEWIVYGCNDQVSLDFVSAAGNPASPFYFLMFLQDGSIRLTGEGIGDAEWTKRAFDDRSALDEEARQALLIATSPQSPLNE